MRLIDADAIKNGKFHSVGDWTPIEQASWQRGWNDAIDAIIDNAPTVDAEPVRHGHWIKALDYYENSHFYYQCSQCGYHQVAYHFADEYKYCTNCGAKMDEVEDDES